MFSHDKVCLTRTIRWVKWSILIACWILFDLNPACHGTTVPASRIQYTREQLLAWNSPSLLIGQYPLSKLPGGILRRENCNSAPGDDAGKVKKRKRGKKGGVCQRLRSKQLTRIALPSLIVGNVQSLRNKLDELQGNVRFLQDYRNSCAMAFTESWLTEQDLDNGLSVDGFGIPFAQTGTRTSQVNPAVGVYAFMSTNAIVLQ